jgi:hypothetical protein
MNRSGAVRNLITAPVAKKAAGLMLTVAGWYVGLATAVITPLALAQFDFSNRSAVLGVFVLLLYVVVLIGFSILLIRSGRRLRAKQREMPSGGSQGRL